jgi:hypothetical protein
LNNSFLSGHPGGVDEKVIDVLANIDRDAMLGFQFLDICLVEMVP